MAGPHLNIWRFPPIAATVLLITVGTAEAQQVSRAPSIQFERLNVEEGLSQSTVLALGQDPQGFMWIGTQSGLNRFDGRDLTIFRHDPHDPFSIGFRTTLALAFEEDGTVWAGLSNGLSRREPITGRFEHIHGGTVRSLEIGRGNALWVGTAGGVNRLDRVTGVVDPFSTTAGSGAALALLEDGDGAVWVGMETGLHRVRTASKAVVPVLLRDTAGSEVRTGAVWSVERAADGLWLGTDFGAFHVNTNSLVTTPFNLSSEKPAMHYAVADPRTPEILWVGGGRGELWHLDTRSGVSRRYNLNAEGGVQRASDRIRSMAVDHAGLVWLGTETSGTIRFDPYGGGFEHLVPGEDRFPDHRFVATIYEDSKGGLWTGTMYPGLLTRWDREAGQRRHWQYRAGDQRSVAEGRINAILEDRTGDIWVGTDIDGLSRIDGSLRGGFRHYHHDRSDPTTISSDSLTILHADRSGRIWVAHYFLGVLDRYNPETDDFTRFQLGDARRTGSIYAFHEDQDGMFWVASRHLYKWDPDKGQVVARFERDPADPSSFLGEASSIHRSNDGTVWLTSLQGGLSRLDPETGDFRHYGPGNSGLPDNEVYHVLEDRNGYLWMSSNRGLTRFDPKSESFLTLTRGLQSLEFTTFAAYRSPRTGEMFFGGPNGVTAFHPESFAPNPTPPLAAFTQLRVDGKEVHAQAGGQLEVALAAAESIRLRPSQRDVSFDFVGLHFRNPAQIQYRYQLAPYDEDPQPTRIPSATYTNLDPGDYTFRIWAANSDGIWSEAREFAVSIAPPWWALSWVRLLGVMGLIALGISTYWWRVRTLEARSERLEREVADRTREVREQRDKLEEQAASLRELSEVKSRFFANISHEFRTPLTLTFGPIEDALAGRYDNLEQARPHFEAARRNGGRLLRLINQLLDLARADSGTQALQLVRRDLASKLQELAGMFAAVAEARGLQFVTHLPEEPFPFVFDADKLEKVVVNLLSNAFKFTPPGGKVDLSLDRREHGAALITIADTGPGIAPEHLPRLFDRFYQVETHTGRAYEGSGIGLSLVKEFVEMHEGSITVESKTDFGTKFAVQLPALRADSHTLEESETAVIDELPAVEEVTAAPVDEGREPSRQEADLGSDEEDLILIVEDNADMRSYITGHLDPAFRVVEAANGVNGVELAQELIPDLVLSDVMMPRMDGIELCRRLKTDDRTSHIPVVLLTARAEVEDRIEGFESGADAYVPKPFNAHELHVRLRALIEERRKLRRVFATGSSPDQADPETTRLNPRETAFLEKASAVVEDHMDDAQFGVDPLAENLAMSRRQLLRKLRALTDESAVALIRRIRMQRASSLLAEGTLSIKEIGAAVGFQSSSSFTRAFRQVHGVTPSEYAEQHIA